MADYDRILVPVTGSEADESAIELAGHMASKATEICIVYVIELKHNESLDAENDIGIKKAESALSRGRDIAASKGYDVQTMLLQARDAASALIDGARERGSNLIVMAVQYKRKFGVFSMGAVIPYVFKKAPCPVMLIQLRNDSS